MAKKKNYSNDLSNLLYINLAILVLLLTLFNLQLMEKRPVKVLGATTDNSYWEEMVKKHPTYRDGWIELGRMDKAKEIDPNFIP